MVWAILRLNALQRACFAALISGQATPSARFGLKTW